MTEPIMPTDNPELDRELADLSDAVVEGRMVKSSAATAEYMPLIRELREITTQPAPGAFRARLTQRLNEEWDQLQRAKTSVPQRERGLRSILTFSPRQVALAAALLIVVIGSAVVLLSTGGSAPPVQGTVLDDPASAAPTLVLLFAAVIIIVLALWWGRDKR